MNRDMEKTMEIFERISRIPRCSKKEERISRWIAGWADDNGFPYKKDKAGNLSISVSASKGAENAPTVILQGHLDMVCEKTPDSGHDFDKDPIELVCEGDWLRAKDTSLGADNGIGVALAMAAATDDSLPRPPLELLFTVDEETGLTGAGKLEPGWLTGKILLNIDSENDEVFTVGCAGGRDTVVKLPVQRDDSAFGRFEYFELKVGGLKGGHSGADIREQRANAVKILSRLLLLLLEKFDARVVSISGGSAHNAIPREASALLALPPENVPSAKEKVSALMETVAGEYRKIEPALEARLEKKQLGDASSVGPMGEADGLKTVRLLRAIPHGVHGMSLDVPGLVETSNNLATVKTSENEVEIVTSQRSSVMCKLDEVAEVVKAAANLAGAKCEDKNGYPAWKPNMDSPLLSECVRIYEGLHGKKPKIEVIHAGLECAVIGSKYPGMDMISFGPNISGAHSPDEKLDLVSAEKVRNFLNALLRAYASL